jgi:hypothetical protein
VCNGDGAGFAGDPYCCTAGNPWDAQCVAEAKKFCGATCP